MTYSAHHDNRRPDDQPPDDELLRLTRMMCDGTISEVMLARLNVLLAESEIACGRYLDYVAVHAELRWRFGGLHDVAATDPTAADPLQTATQDAPRPSTRPVRGSLPSTIKSVAKSAPAMVHGLRELGREFAAQPLSLVLLAVSLFSGAVLAYTFWSHPADPARQVGRIPVAPQVPAAVATLAGSLDAAWDPASLPTSDRLASGQRLRLMRGLAEIAFVSQASVVVEGPIDFTLSGPNGCTVAAGKLVAHVPTAARGFVVDTPTLRIVDLGTEFGVAVKAEPALPPSSPRQSSDCEVHVMVGEVAITPTSLQVAQAATDEHADTGVPATSSKPKSEILKAGQAVRSSADSPELEKKTAEPSKFVRRIPLKLPTAGLISHWPLDGNGRATIGQDCHQPDLVNRAAPDRFGTEGQALIFDCLKQSPLMVPQGGGLDGLRQGSICLFVKWSGKQGRGGAVLARQHGHNFFSDNVLLLSGDDPATGTLQWMGANTAVKLTGVLMGRTPVGDGTWRHVAVTFGPQRQELFLDGVLETRGPGLPDGLHRDPGVSLTIGAWPGDGESCANGAIDDLKIFDRQLTTAEIKALATTPVATETPERKGAAPAGDGAAGP